MNRKKRPASRGFVNNIILESLFDGDKYGYEIIKEVEDKSNGKVVLKQPSLYSSLKRFEQKGLISSYWGDSDIGGRRHYYTITELGKKFFLSNGKMNLDDIEDLKSEVAEAREEYDETLVPLGDDAEVYEVDDNNQDDDLSDTYIKTLHSETENNESDNEPHESKELSQEELNEIILQDEHIFGAKDVYRQNDLFSNDDNQSTTLPMNEENVDFEAIKSAKQEDSDNALNSTEKEVEKNPEQYKAIPLIKEKEVSFDNWEDLKRKTLQNKKSFADSYDTVSNFDSSSKFVDIDFDNNNNSVTQHNDAKIITTNIPVDTDNINLTLKSRKIDRNIDDSPTPLDNRTEQSYIDHKDDHSYVKSTQKDIDYKSILGELYTGEEGQQISTQNDYTNLVKEELRTDYTNIEPTYDITPKTKHTIDTLIEEGFKYKPYNCNVKKSNFDFVKINKLNLVSGFIIALIMALQTGLLLYLLDIKNMFDMRDMPLYIIGFGLSLGIFVYNLVLYLYSPNKRANKHENLKYNLWFGVLGFVSVSILTLAVNLILGCTMQNITTIYMTSMILPILLSTNFIIHPIVHHILISNRTFYK